MQLLSPNGAKDWSGLVSLSNDQLTIQEAPTAGLRSLKLLVPILLGCCSTQGSFAQGSLELL